MRTRSIPDRIRNIELPPFDPLNLRAAELRQGGHHVISLGQALPFFAPPASAMEGARAALDRPDVHRYSTDPGLPSLRGVLAERLAEATGSHITPNDLIITAGANHAFTLALTTLVDPGDDVLLPSPYFTNHQMAVCALGATPVEAPVADRDTFAVRWSDIEPRLTTRTRAVVLCTPSNPTGATIDADEGNRIVGELAARGVVVISDETYMNFVFEGEGWSAASAPAWRENVVTIGTFSKAFGMMGWRVGYMLADAGVCAQAVKIQDAMIICAPVISQMAVEGSVRHDWSYARCFHDSFRERRRIMGEGLASIARLQWTPTRGGLFAFTRVTGCSDSTALSHDLLERAHVVSIPGAAFGSAGEGFLRLSYGFASLEDLREAVRRLSAYFSRFTS
ncbi:MAG TPA: pyridoxal phosphate-dependent aminotransferase [Vicinamibacterales bacterium]|nr:pyridoxal phosphate-dependent aminotransferase [Vicinamibacterales bacterium]